MNKNVMGGPILKCTAAEIIQMNLQVCGMVTYLGKVVQSLSSPTVNLAGCCPVLKPNLFVLHVSRFLIVEFMGTFLVTQEFKFQIKFNSCFLYFESRVCLNCVFPDFETKWHHPSLNVITYAHKLLLLEQKITH